MRSPSCPPHAKRAHQAEFRSFPAHELDPASSLRSCYPLSQVGKPRRVPVRRHSIGAEGLSSSLLAPLDQSRAHSEALRRQIHLERIHTARPRAPRAPERSRPSATSSGTQTPRVHGVEGSVAAAAERVNAYGPATFGARLGATWRVMCAHADYAEALGAMWMHRLGSGMLAGSFMVLISGLGTASPVQSVLTLAIVDLLSHIIPPVVSVHGAHVRDDADALARVGVRTTPSQYARGLLWTAVGDGMIAAAMFTLAWNVAYHGLAGPWLLVPLAVLRLLQTCLGFYEFNLFNAFKGRLPPPDVEIPGTNQHYTIVSSGIRFVVLSVEANVGATLVSIATAGVVFAAESMIQSSMFHPAALTGIAVGGLIAAMPKLVFCRYVNQGDAP